MSRAICFMSEPTRCYSGALDVLGGPLISLCIHHIYCTPLLQTYPIKLIPHSSKGSHCPGAMELPEDLFSKFFGYH